MEMSQTTQVGRISAEDAKARLARGEPIVFLDARHLKAWTESDVKTRVDQRGRPAGEEERLRATPPP
jgi:hypothetical protein